VQTALFKRFGKRGLPEARGEDAAYGAGRADANSAMGQNRVARGRKGSDGKSAD
jgi:hypothetical protein